MERRSRSIESPRRYKNRRDHRRYSRSRSRSRNRSKDRRRRSRSRTRSRSRDRYGIGRSQERDLYNDIINEDYGDNYDRYRSDRRGRDRDRGTEYERDRRDRERNRDYHKRYHSPEKDDGSDISYESDTGNTDGYRAQKPTNTIFIRGLAQHITEEDITEDLRQYGLTPYTVRLKFKRKGASRGFAFVSFYTEEEASKWMEIKQGVLVFQGQFRASMQYSSSSDNISFWNCIYCGFFNFHIRYHCFKCLSPREESENIDVVGKKIMLRNLDALTNEEGVLTVMQEVIPQLVSKISKILICRDPLTSLSRGICYLFFENLIDSMNTMKALKELEQPLKIENREVLISYCVDSENKQKEQFRGAIQKDASKVKVQTDWYCSKCGIMNFKRRIQCFGCNISRKESEANAGDIDYSVYNANANTNDINEASSNILSKKIMLRNLNVLTNEENILAAMQTVIPTLASKISKIFIVRDPISLISRGVCYLYFDYLVDSMNAHNALKALEPPLQIQSREVTISYGMDTYNKPANKQNSTESTTTSSKAIPYATNTYQYTLSDVPRLAEYSASMYASNVAEHEHYMKYYTQYYMTEITKGKFANLPTMTQLNQTSANSGAAVALSAIQRKQNKYKNITDAAVSTASIAAINAIAAAASQTAQTVPSISTPKGNDGKKYPTPDTSLYQYDETSGYYYDPITGLYYDAHSQYYYNNETGAYLYWDAEKSTYLLAPANTQATAAAASATTAAAAIAAASTTTTNSTTTSSTISSCAIPAAPPPPDISSDDKKEEAKVKENKQDKVKVAKKIVKDMEKWAKQLNQKKEMSMTVATPAPILPVKSEEISLKSFAGSSNSNSGYADVGFSILEKKERGKLELSSCINKLVSSYGSDSDEHEDNSSHSASFPSTSYGSEVGSSEKDYVDFDKLTCLLCKRAFQSLDILNKHLKMSNLHKENLQKFNLTRGHLDAGGASGGHGSYRDRAKERRLKYGESDPPPPNRSRERFEKELKSVTSTYGPTNTPIAPIGENNVGNRLLQKMGWTEGQGLGRSNQGRTNIIEVDGRSSTAGLGTKASQFGPGDDYKTYIKRMMKSRYEQVDIKQ